MLESTEMVVPVGSWVLKQACRQAVAWHRLGHNLMMSVNVSTRQLEADDFVERLEQMLAAASLEPTSLIIDVAETKLVDATEAVQAPPTRAQVPWHPHRRRRLRHLLIAGPPSRLPITALKLDESFVAAMADSPDAIESIHHLLELCRKLGIETFAKGIEQGWQLATLQKEQCRFGQGSFFSHPIPAEALEAILSLEPLFS